MDMFWTLVVVVAGVAVGALIATVWFRVRAHDLLEAAVAHGREGLQIELATQVERLRALEAEALQARQDLLRARQDGEVLQRDLLAANQDRARLSERASRVATLEAQAKRAALQLRMSEQELRRLAASEAQKTEALRAQADQARRRDQDDAHIDEVLQPMRAELDGLRQRLEQALAASRA